MLRSKPPAGQSVDASGCDVLERSFSELFLLAQPLYMSRQWQQREQVNREAWTMAADCPQALVVLSLQVATGGEWWPPPPAALRLSQLNFQAREFCRPRILRCMLEAAARQGVVGDVEFCL